MDLFVLQKLIESFIPRLAVRPKERPGSLGHLPNHSNLIESLNPFRCEGGFGFILAGVGSLGQFFFSQFHLILVLAIFVSLTMDPGAETRIGREVVWDCLLHSDVSGGGIH